MNPTLRKTLLQGGRRLIKKLQKLMGRYSLVGDHKFFPAEQFPPVAELEANTVRPLPFPISLLNSLVIKSIAASPFIRDAKKNHEDRERRMSDLWN